jgi:hypothetical protein
MINDILENVALLKEISSIIFVLISLLCSWRLIRTAEIHRLSVKLIAERIKKMRSQEKEVSA